jgi:hypothetical protein
MRLSPILFVAVADLSRLRWRSAMGEVVTVGLDIAKSVFQVHAVDAEAQVVVQCS